MRYPFWGATVTETTTEIPRQDWVQSLNRFNAVHEGWLVTVEVLSSDLGAQPEIVDLPLVGITFEQPAGGTMTIAAGSADDQIVHVIRSPERMWLARLDGRADVALEVEAAEGLKTIVRFKSPVAPETVDGLPRSPTAARHR